jgi:hypoxanthine phosphoribosyltransferase
LVAVVAGGLYIGAALADWWNEPQALQPVTEIPVVALDDYATAVVATEIINSEKPKKRVKKKRNKPKFKTWGWQPF